MLFDLQIKLSTEKQRGVAEWAAGGCHGLYDELVRDPESSEPMEGSPPVVCDGLLAIFSWDWAKDMLYRLEDQFASMAEEQVGYEPDYDGTARSERKVHRRLVAPAEQVAKKIREALLAAGVTNIDDPWPGEDSE